jgi:hypothetical protein
LYTAARKPPKLPDSYYLETGLEKERYSGSREEDGSSDAKLVAFVPTGEVVINTRKQPSLKDTKPSARMKKLSVALDEAHPEEHTAPDDHGDRKPDMGFESFEKDV